jgi:DnaJ-class molecular chaperone
MDFYRTVICALCKGWGKFEMPTGFAPPGIITRRMVICPDCNGAGKIRRAGVTPKRPKYSC